jgi:hypothetical protein
MAYDRVTAAADLTDNPDGLSVLVVDPDVLSATAQLLREQPRPQDPRAPALTAEMVGNAALAEAFEAFDTRFREVAEALADDNDRTAGYLDDAADAYQRVEDRITAILTDTTERLHDAPENTDPDRTHRDDAGRDDTGRDDWLGSGTERERRDEGSQYAEWGDNPARYDSARYDPVRNDHAGDGTDRDGAWADGRVDAGWDEAAERAMSRRIREALEA